MWCRRWLAAAGMAATLTGCALVDPVDSRYDTIGRSLAKSRNELIFLNLVRASHDYPLSFITVANVTPSQSNTSTLALPSFLLGPSPRNVEPVFTPGRDVALSSSVASNTTAISTNFSVATQETSAFYDGFLKPIDLETLDDFVRQDYSRELLFWLFTDSVEMDYRDGPKLLFNYNPPYDYGCPSNDPKGRCFREFILIAMYMGLTVEQVTIQTPSSGSAGGGGSPSVVTNAVPNNRSNTSKAATTIFARFCFDRLLARWGQLTMDPNLVKEIQTKYLDASVTPASLSPICGSHWNPQKEAGTPQPETLPLSAGTIKFKITPRSAFGIFEFLGKLIKMQRDHPEPGPRAYYPDRPEILAPPELATVFDDRNVFRMDFNRGGNCFAHTWFIDGDYCVPESAANTKRIFNLLAQLIAIQTQATDLSITPVVRVIQ
jgi:hypothetical protein